MLRNLIAGAPATALLLAANAILFLLEEFSGGSRNPEVALSYGALTLPHLRAGQWYRLVTSMFLHFGLMHLLCNLWALLILGPRLEMFFGLRLYLLLYLLSGVAGNLQTAWRDARTGRNAVSAGASGAVFGLLGAYLALGLLPATRDAVNLRSVLYILALNLAIGIASPAINLAAHIGGLLAGLLLAVLFVPLL